MSLLKKLNITKEQYCKIVEAIQEHYRKLTKFEDTINEFNDGTYICTIGDVLVNNILSLLTELTHDQEDKHIGTWLSWWLWEDVEKVVWDAEDNRIDVSTADKLYDFLATNYNRETKDE